MAILCGTDFSAAAGRALTAAAHLAARTKTRLHLVHATQLDADALEGELKADHMQWVGTRLGTEAERARALGADVTVHLTKGPPDEALIALAAEIHAQLIVIGPLGGRAEGSFKLGGHADRLVQRSHVPVLIVRDAEPFASWLREQRPLRVVLGADLSRSTDAAMNFVDGWRRLAPCKLTAVHLYWPPQQFVRLGLEGVRSYIDPEPEVVATLTRELTHRLASAVTPEPVEVQVEPHLGRLGDRLADIAFARGADLLVVGNHARNALHRIWEGTVSRWALHAARGNVLCVPAPAPASDVRVPRMRNVLAATDFSDAGNAAVGLAFALAEAGGTVHLAHVVPAREMPPLAPRDIFAIEFSTQPDAQRLQVLASLAALAPSDARDRAVRYHVLTSHEPAHAIAQAAVRLDADAICVGRRDRSSLAQTLLGSVSQQVLACAEQPVFVAQAKRE
jgi:nucleotide-binding universal stress UspA family protein